MTQTEAGDKPARHDRLKPSPRKRVALSGPLKRHAALSGTAALTSVGGVAWLQPETTGGTAFVVAIIFILINLVGAIHPTTWRRKRRLVRKHAITWLLLGAVSGLSACIGAVPSLDKPASSPPSRAGAVVSPERPGATASGALRQYRTLRPVRAFLPARAIPPAEVGAYGIVAFGSLPTPASRDRLKKVCLAYLAALPSQDSIPTNIPLRDQMITFFPVRGNPPVNPDCDWLIDNYDLFGGTSAIQDAQTQGESMRGRGPFLIGWSPSSTRGIKSAVVLVLDLSPFESQVSFDAQFEFWREKIVDNPSVWRSGFSVERVRLAAHDFADRYGSDIMKSINTWAR